MKPLPNIRYKDFNGPSTIKILLQLFLVFLYFYAIPFLNNIMILLLQECFLKLRVKSPGWNIKHSNNSYSIEGIFLQFDFDVKKSLIFNRFWLLNTKDELFLKKPPNFMPFLTFEYHKPWSWPFKKCIHS